MLRIMERRNGLTITVGTDTTGREEPNSLDEIDGMNVYCCAWDADGVKEEIADVCGVSANEVKLYAFSRWARMPVYEAI